MADGVHIGMAAATARLAQLDAIADNLANAQTPGFLAERQVFEAVLRPELSQPSVQARSAGVDLGPGSVIQTDRSLDVAPQDGAFIGVWFGDDVALTRDGRLSVGADGVLHAAGHPVVSARGGMVSLPPGSTSIDASGQITVDGQAVDKIALFRVDGEARRLGPGVIGVDGSVELIEQPLVKVGAVVGSNAGSLEATVALIGAQRGFDQAMQAVQTYRRLDERAVELGRVRG